MTNIYTIPSTAPFLDHLVRAILSGHLPKQNGKKPSPEQLASYTLLLPTRRACRACAEAFLRHSGKGENEEDEGGKERGGQRAIILPVIRPIGDSNEDESLIHDSLSGLESRHALLESNPAISSLERHLILTAFVLLWQKAKNNAIEGEPRLERPTSPAQASLMARELVKLIDTAETENVSLENLKDLVPDEFSVHWQHTLELLKIVTEAYPAYLQNTKQMNGASRRNNLLLKEAERLEASPPKGPVILAGSTGSVPAAARLMRAIASLDQGAIVLPGLDQFLDQASFDELASNHPEHPQFGLAHLLTELNTPRENISALQGSEPTKSQAALLSFMSEALRPASTTDQWQAYIDKINEDSMLKSELRDSFAPLTMAAARDAQEEAELIALILRETANNPLKTAALITPDRLLARRVAVRLEAWGIKVDDSGGRPLAKTMPGAFMDQILEVITSDFAPAELLALLKHPLTRLGFERGESRLAARAVELIALRQPWLGGGLERIEQNVTETKTRLDEKRRTHPAISRLSEEEWTLAGTLVTRLKAAFAPLIATYKDPSETSLTAFLNAHIEVAETLSQLASEKPASEERLEEGTEEQKKAPDQDNQTEDMETNNSPLWLGAAGEQLARLLAELMLNKAIAPPLSSADYAEFYRSLIAGETVRPLTPVHPRLFIWGPFEARLQQPDIVILGGLNEGTWPATAVASPLLSRPMCEELGLPTPEQHIGYSAHDFASLMAARKVYLTRAAKSDGVQTVPSRWLMRMTSLLEGLEMADCLAPAKEDPPFAKLAEMRDQVTTVPAVKRPAPKPPLTARPRRLSVTQIEDWIANPYSIFASKILNLTALEPIGGAPDAALRGQIIHEALQKFTEQYPDELPADTASALSDIAAGLMEKYGAHPRIKAFWQPRFNRFANWFAEGEDVRRRTVEITMTEKSGQIELDMPYAPFTLSARADRIDLQKDGSYRIYDYKTGTLPKVSAVRSRHKPQLPLEGAIVQLGGFKGLEPGPVSLLGYISAKGGEPAGEVAEITAEQVPELIDEALEKLKMLIARYDQPGTAYEALRRKKFDDQYRYDDYAHLARVEEWGNESEGEG